MWIFYFFALIVIWLGLASLRGGLGFRSYVRIELSKPISTFTPFVSLFAPCCGFDQGLRENLGALFSQNYPAYEIIFVTGSADDSAIAVIEEVCREYSHLSDIESRIVFAGKATDCGQKVHNLRAAVTEANALSEVFVFVDSDARPVANFLSSLVAPLADTRIGAATGYRWFIPERGGFSSYLRAVWNASIASALGARGDKNFCWGGATAILGALFERLDMLEQWRGTASDDFTLTRALQREKLPIYFVPACLTACVEDCDFKELLEFTTRQLKITRVYASHLWIAVLLGSALFVLVFFGGIALVITRAALGLSYAVPLALLVLIFTLGALKALLRLRAVGSTVGLHAGSTFRPALMHLTLWPLASVLHLYNAIAALCSRTIHWRGITYELKSPTETVMIRNEKQQEVN